MDDNRMIKSTLKKMIEELDDIIRHDILTNEELIYIEGTIKYLEGRLEKLN